MPNLNAKEYEELRSLISSPDPAITAEMRDRAYKAVSAFDEQFETGMRGGLSTEQALAMGPPSNEQDDVIRRLDPSQPLMPQALAAAPATTHEGGDKAAEAEWLAGAGGQNGTVFVYEPPLDVVKQKLIENPQLSAALGYQHVPFTAQDIAAMKNGDSLYQAYADYEWRKTAEEAAKSGKVAYRYSKAPWLQASGAMVRLKGAAPLVAEGIGSLIMGVDDAASFGIGAAAGKGGVTGSPMADERMLLQQLPGDNPADAMKTGESGVEFKGLGEASLDQLAENNPAMHTAGQALGALAPWGATNRLFNFVTSGGAGLAARAGGGFTARTLAAGGSGALAGAAEQGVREIVSGRGAADPEGVLGRLQGGVFSGGALGAGAFGAGGEALGSLAQGAADWVRWGGRYEGAPGRLETSGLAPKLGRGYVGPPEIRQATQEGRALGGIDAVDVLAKKAAPGVEAGADEMVKEVIGRATEVQKKYYPSREGQMRLPLTKSAQTVVDLARAGITRNEQGKALLIGRPELQPLLKRFNNEIVGAVSLKPVEGAIELSADEADLILSPVWKRKLTPPKEPKGGGGGGSGGARDVDLVSIGDTPKVDIEARAEQPTMDVDAADIEDIPDVREAATVPPKGKAAKPAGKVEGPPERDITPTAHLPATNQAINEYGEAMAPVRDAQRAEAKRMESLAAEGARGPITTPPPSPRASRDVELPDQEALKKAGWVPQHIDLKGEALEKAWKAEKVFFKTGKDGKRQAYTIIPAKPQGKWQPLTHDKARELGLLAGTAAVAGGAEALSEGSGENVAAAGVFASALKRRGVGKVYVVPNRLTAEAHDAFTDRIQDHARPVQGQDKPAQREWGMLQKAAFQDRDARPYEGEAGGWSAVKKAESEAIGQAKDLQSRVTGGRDGAFREVVQYARPRTGELLDVEAIRKAADKGGKGVREQIERARQAGDIEKVRAMSSYGRGAGGQRISPLSPTGLFDAAVLRFGQPGLRALEGPGLRGGMGGRLNLIGRDPAEEENR